MTSQIKKGLPKGSAQRVEQHSVLRLDERGRQVIRLMDVLRALENTRRGLTVSELIEQLDLNCSARTIYRDLEQLQRAGFGWIEEDSRYRIADSTIKSEPLTDSQMLAVFLAADLLAPLSGFGVEREFLILRDSLRARLTPQRRKWVDALRSMIAVRSHTPRHRSDDDVLEVIEDAWIKEQILEIEYAKPNQESQRRFVEPYLLWCHGAQTYLVARCPVANALRNFSLSRIRSAKMLEETFEKASDFEPEEYIKRGFGAYHGPSHDITLLFSHDVAHLADEKNFHSSQTVEHTSDGTAQLSFTAAGLPEIAAWVASFGGKVRVISPAELRTAVRAIHQAGLIACSEESHPETLTSDVTGRV